MSRSEAESRFNHLLEPLAWDSEHFGFPVARLRLLDLDDKDVIQALESAIRARYRLVYWTTRADREVPTRILETHGGLLADRRAVFELSHLPVSVSNSKTSDKSFASLAPSSPSYQIVQLPRGPASPRLVALGISAGADSRFRTDWHIPLERFERLYEIWIQRSTLHELADAVLIAVPTEGEPIGLVTVTERGGLGQIGLIAVAEEARRRGVGTRLIEFANQWMATRGATTARVVTQFHNQGACRLYTHMGYHLAELARIYHFWPLDAAGEISNP